jgi:hypothetical protein
MIGLAFFYLLRPGEYARSSSDSTPFEFRDVQLFRGQLRLNLHTATEPELLTSTFASLTFRDHKNSAKGEVIGPGHSGDSLLSPPRILGRRIIHLRTHGAASQLPYAGAMFPPAGFTSNPIIPQTPSKTPCAFLAHR